MIDRNITEGITDDGKYLDTKKLLSYIYDKATDFANKNKMTNGNQAYMPPIIINNKPITIHIEKQGNNVILDTIIVD